MIQLKKTSGHYAQARYHRCLKGNRPMSHAAFSIDTCTFHRVRCPARLCPKNSFPGGWTLAHACSAETNDPNLTVVAQAEALHYSRLFKPLKMTPKTFTVSTLDHCDHCVHSAIYCPDSAACSRNQGCLPIVRARWMVFLYCHNNLKFLLPIVCAGG
jgi:hypothetical protein